MRTSLSLQSFNHTVFSRSLGRNRRYIQTRLRLHVRLALLRPENSDRFADWVLDSIAYRPTVIHSFPLSPSRLHFVDLLVHVLFAFCVTYTYSWVRANPLEVTMVAR